MRLVKSYLLFLQSAVMAGDPGNSFDENFLTASAPWSRLYWHTINSAHGHLEGATAARQVLVMSTGVFATGEPATETELSRSSVKASTNMHAENDVWESLSKPRLHRPSWIGWIWSELGGSKHKAVRVSQQWRMGLRASERWAKVYGTLGLFINPQRTVPMTDTLSVSPSMLSLRINLKLGK